MNELTSIILGAVVCLVVPALSLSAGIYIGRHGFPIEVRWRSNPEE